jgi:hypothetical protein
MKFSGTINETKFRNYEIYLTKLSTYTRRLRVILKKKHVTHPKIK